MNVTVKSRWTPADEAALLELQNRKVRIMEEAREPVRRIVQQWGDDLLLGTVETITSMMIADAEALRDALWREARMTQRQIVLTPAQMKAARKAMKRLIAAEIADSWKGGGDPEHIPGVERELREARKELSQLFFSREEGTP